MTDSRNYVIVSADGHCGADLRDYKKYLERRYHDEFDAWADTFHDGWDALDADRPADNRMGFADSATELNWDSDARLAYSEADGVAAEVLFPNTPPPFFPAGVLSAPQPRTAHDYEYRLAGVRAHNRWLAEFCRAVPGRRAGFAQVFLYDVDDAVAEIKWAKENGLAGVLLPGDHVQNLVTLYYPHLDPVWEVCADLDMPVHRHTPFPVESPDEGGIATGWIGAMEATFYAHRAIPHLICAGVFERFPRLKLVITESPNGAAIADLIKKLDYLHDPNASDQRPHLAESVAALPDKPSTYFERNCFVAAPLDFRASYDAGVPNLMFGTDLPHSEGTAPFTREVLKLVMPDLQVSEIRRLLGETAAEVYGFDLVELQKVADRVGFSPADIAEPLRAEDRPRFPEETRCYQLAQAV